MAIMWKNCPYCQGGYALVILNDFGKPGNLVELPLDDPQKIASLLTIAELRELEKLLRTTVFECNRWHENGDADGCGRTFRFQGGTSRKAVKWKRITLAFELLDGRYK